MDLIIKRDTWADGKPIFASDEPQSFSDEIGAALRASGKGYQPGEVDPRPDVTKVKKKAAKPAQSSKVKVEK